MAVGLLVTTVSEGGGSNEVTLVAEDDEIGRWLVLVAALELELMGDDELWEEAEEEAEEEEVVGLYEPMGERLPVLESDEDELVLSPVEVGDEELDEVELDADEVVAGALDEEVEEVVLGFA